MTPAEVSHFLKTHCGIHVFPDGDVDKFLWCGPYVDARVLDKVDRVVNIHNRRQRNRTRTWMLPAVTNTSASATFTTSSVSYWTVTMTDPS